MAKVTFEGVTFNANWANTKTEKEFVAHEKHHGLSDSQLKEAHNLCKTAVKAPETPVTAQPTT